MSQGEGFREEKKANDIQLKVSEKKLDKLIRQKKGESQLN